jgi:hypothetical protein
MTTNVPRARRLAICLVFLVVCAPSAAILLMVIDQRASGGAGLPDYSVYSDAPDGLAQAGALLRRLGWQPVALTQSLQQSHVSGLLIVMLPPAAPFPFARKPVLGDADADHLLNWVSRGNAVLLCSPSPTVVHYKLGVDQIEAAAGDDVVFGRPGAAGEYTAGVQRIGVESKATVAGARALPLWWIGNQPGAVAVRHGRGRVLFVADPSLLTHRGLLREDNALFLYNVAALDAVDGRVYFDEYHHGIHSSAGFWSYLRFHHQQFVMVHLLLAALVGFWAVGRRLGPAIPQPRVQRTDGVAYASSVARIYEKADVRPLVAGVYARHFLQEVTRRVGLRRSSLPAEILAAWRRRDGDRDLADLRGLLETASRWRDGARAAPKEMLETARRFDAFIQVHFRKAKGK